MKKKIFKGILVGVVLSVVFLVGAVILEATEVYHNFYGVQIVRLYGQITTLNQGSAYFALFKGPEGNTRFSVDSTGAVYPSMAAGTSTSYLPTTKGTIDLGSATYYWRSGYFATIFNKTTSFLDSSGNVNITGYLKSANAGIDSFSTTGATKTETVTGATAPDVVIVTPLCPAYSATPDTGQQYSGFVSAAGTITITRSTLRAGGTTKSGAQFNWVYLRQH